MSPPARVVDGLGNPASIRGGPLRVNAGAIVLDAIAGGAPFRRAGVIEIFPVTLLDVSVSLLKVSGFMGRAGPPVARHIHDLHLDPPRLIVLHDDAETLRMGRLRVRTRALPAGTRGWAPRSGPSAQRAR